MTKPTKTLEAQIIEFLKKREDIWLDDSVSPDDGAPNIRGVRLVRFKETEVRGPDSYHPFTYIGWRYVGQAFAVETEIVRGMKPFSKSQIKWREKFEMAGGLYVEGRMIEDVYLELGKARPEPWGEYLTRQTRIGRGN